MAPRIPFLVNLEPLVFTILFAVAAALRLVGERIEESEHLLVDIVFVFYIAFLK